MAKNDTYSQLGAERLARTIERKWREKNKGNGAIVKAWAESQNISGYDEPLWFVQSNLVNGLPPAVELRKAA